MSALDKLDARTRHLLKRAGEGTGTDVPPRVGVFLRGRGTFTDDELEALRSEGSEVRTVAGDVLTATVPVDAITRLARHDFVVSLQVSGPLYVDSRPEDSRAGDEPTAAQQDVE